jgi:Leu/Phe-tRNA-protein transferase
VADLRARLRLYQSPATLYWSRNWSVEFYRLLARAGFINISFEDPQIGEVLIPEMQQAYAVLDWPNLKVSRSMRRWMRSAKCTDGEYSLQIGYDLGEIIAGIQRTYVADTWLNDRYARLLFRLAQAGCVDDFEVMTAALVSGPGARLVAGEVGYRVGKIYTSLSGFFERGDASLSNVGTLQLVRLAQHLEEAGFAFWNLGHPGMQYKQDLGARILPRAVFLRRWFAEGAVG